MDFSELLEKIASGEEQMDSMEKLAAYYDGMGRELFWGMLNNRVEAMQKVARKLPPGTFSGKKGLLKLLGLGALGGGGFAAGSHMAKKRGEKDDVALANRAYQMGVKRGATMVIQKLRGMGG